MEQNNINIEQNNPSDENTGGFWHSGWAFLVFFAGIAGLLIGLTYFVKWLL
jgi:hypothetical protein